MIADVHPRCRYRLLNATECMVTFDHEVKTVEWKDTVNLGAPMPGGQPSYRIDVVDVIDTATICHAGAEETITLHGRSVVTFDGDGKCTGLESDFRCAPTVGRWEAL